ncbi:hypothetical protein ACH5RR_025800 [Cinchona calisaya]|uniref:Uncharacterized protein n=1 Tax=Cinchona calisaya TaxID=153742 RepID=A0ABD2Z1T8_9GENT
MEIPVEHLAGKMARAYVLSPISTTSPRNEKSNLYDSYELQAVMKQLNRAIQGSKAPLSPSSYYLKSPVYRRRLDLIYKENAKAPRKVTGSQNHDGDVEVKKTAKNTKGLQQLWKKVKQTFVVARHKYPQS